MIPTDDLRNSLIEDVVIVNGSFTAWQLDNLSAIYIQYEIYTYYEYLSVTKLWGLFGNFILQVLIHKWQMIEVEQSQLTDRANPSIKYTLPLERGVDRSVEK